MSSPVLVTGASGQLGQRVVELLLERGARVIALTRHPEKLTRFATRGVDVRKADFDDPSTLPDAFRGAERALLVSTDALDRPGRRYEQHAVAIRALEAAGVKHVVYTSWLNVVGSSVAIAGDHEQTEAELAASKLGFTILRNAMYTDMLLGSLPRAVASGQLVNAQDDAPVAYVTREDCARAAAAALLDGFEGRRTVDVTGPEGVTSTVLAAILSDVAARPVTYVPIPVEALVQGMVGAGLPEPLARVFASFDVAIAKGELARPTGDFERLTGRKPQSVRDFLGSRSEALAAK